MKVPSKRFLAAAAAAVSLLFLADSGFSQQTSADPLNMPISGDNWDIFRIGSDAIDEGDKASDKNEFETALAWYRRASAAFQKLRTDDPNWNKSVVNYRISLTNRKIDSAERKLNELDVVKVAAVTAVAKSDKPSETKTVTAQAINETAIAELAKLRKQIETLTAQLAENKAALETAQKTAKDTNAKLTKAEKDAADANEKNRSLSKELDTLKGKPSADNKLSEVEKKLADANGENKKLTAQISDLQTKLSDANNKVAANQKSMEDLKSASESAQKRLADVQKTVNTLQTSYTQTKQSESKLLQQVSDLKKDAADYPALKQKNEEQGKALAESQKKSADLQKELGDLRVQLDEIKKVQAAKPESLENELANARKELETTKTKLNAAESKSVELTQQVADLKNLLENAQNMGNSAELTQQVKALKDQLENMRKAALKESVKIAQETSGTPVDENTLQKLIDELEQTKKNLSESDSKVKQLTADKTALQGKVDSLTKAQADAKKSSGDLSKEAETKIAKLTIDNEALQNKVNTLTKAQAEAEKNVSAENAELTASLANAKKEMADLQKQFDVKLEKLGKDKSDLQNKVDSLTKAQTNANDAVAKAQKEAETQIIQLRDDKKALQGKIDSLTKAQEDSAKKIEEQKKQLADAQLKIQSAAGKTPEVKNESNAELAASLQQANQDKTLLTEELAKVRKDLVSAQAQLEKMKIEQAADPELRRLNDSLSDVNVINKQLTNDRSKLEEQIVELTEKNESLTVTLTGLLSKHADMTAKIQRLESELELRRKDPSSVQNTMIAEKDDTINTLLQERSDFDKMITDLTVKLNDERSLNSRYRKTMNAAKTVAETAITEATRLRNELIAYRKDDPNPRPEVPKTLDTIPEEIMPLFESINETAATSDGKLVSTLPIDKLRFEEAMKLAKQAEEAKDFTAALWQYLIAVDANPADPDSRMSLARVHMILEHADQALKAYEKALQLGAKRDLSLEDLIKRVQSSDK